MNSVIDAHNEFVENYNEAQGGLLGLLSNQRKVTKINPHVALYCYPNYKKKGLTAEDRLLFLLQEKFGMQHTELIKEIIPEIMELTDPEYWEPYEREEEAIEREPDKLMLGFMDSLFNNNDHLTSGTTIRWTESSAIKSDLSKQKEI